MSLFFLQFVTCKHVKSGDFSSSGMVSARLDCDGDYVGMADSESLNNIGLQVTMEAWIKVTAFPDRFMAMIFKGDERTSNLTKSDGMCQKLLLLGVRPSCEPICELSSSDL